MIQSLMVGIGLTVALVLVWALVQAHWKNAFHEEYSGDDVLAGRRSCSNCGCTTICERKKDTGDMLHESHPNKK